MSSVQANDPVILPEVEDYSADTDSSLGTDIASSTTSIQESVYRHRLENGRTYHAYKEGKYYMPNDEVELDRLDLQHHLFTLTFDGKLFTCPISKQNVHRALDAGCGTGIWAIDFADEHPESKVLGIDLSPIQPELVPPNLIFQVDDLEEEWSFSENEKFDFIYARMLKGSIRDWPAFFEQSYNNLTPGGWIELADIDISPRSDDNSFPKDSALLRSCDLSSEASIKAGRPIRSAELYKSQLQSAGFVNVVETIYKWPINHWPRDKKFKELGLWSHENVSGGMPGFVMQMYTKVLGWSVEDVERFLVDVRSELRDTRIHAYWPIYVVYGQRPQ